MGGLIAWLTGGATTASIRLALKNLKVGPLIFRKFQPLDLIILFGYRRLSDYRPWRAG